jgi:hypothetical protein
LYYYPFRLLSAFFFATFSPSALYIPPFHQSLSDLIYSRESF